MHWEVEQACLFKGKQQDSPEMPRVWLGFTADDEVEIEPQSPGLMHQAWQEVALWFQAGRPDNWPRLPCLGTQEAQVMGGLGKKVSNVGMGWRDVARQLGQVDANFVLTDVLARWQVQNQDGFYLLPLDFFTVGSPQKPLLRAAMTYLDMTGLLGRWRGDTRLEKKEIDKTLPRIQVVRLQDRSQLSGFWDGITYDFQSVAPEHSHRFAVVSRM